MPKVICPACEASMGVGKSGLTLGSRLRCGECGALLEVIEDDPIELEWILDDEDDPSEADDDPVDDDV